MRTSETITEIAKALNKSQGCLENAKKSADNPFFRSKYADLAEVWDTCRKPLSDNGLSVIQSIDSEITPDKGTANKAGLQLPLVKVAVTSRLQHISGEFYESIFSTVAEADPQDLGKVATYMRRYGMMALIGIAPEDDDAESVTDHNKKAPRPIQQPPTTKEAPQEGGKKEHWCPIHNTEFFKKGNMKGYAHPVTVDGKETGKWCNEVKAMPEEIPSAPPPIASQSPQNEQGTALKPEVVETVTPPAIDMVALRADMKKAHWPERTAFSWLNGQYKLASIPNDSLGQMLSRITPEQAAEFVAKMKDLAEAAGIP